MAVDVINNNAPSSAGEQTPATQPRALSNRKDEEKETAESEKAAVKKWCAKIRKAKKRWEKEFDRMRSDMDFAYGYQWPGQEKLDDGKVYVANLVLQAINQLVANLYARNPQATATRRKRKEFVLWDERLETLGNAVASMEQSMMGGAGIPDMESMAIIQDYQAGRLRQEIMKNVGETLEIAYQFQVDNQEPSFKEQLKQVVRTAVVCGVSYVRLNFCRDEQVPMSTIAPGQSMKERVNRAKSILEKLDEKEITDDNASVETLKSLFLSFGLDTQADVVSERLVFDFPPSTSIIPDPRCRNLKTLSGARWMVQEYILPLDEVNEFFETSIKATNDVKMYNSEGVEERVEMGSEDGEEKANVAVWEVFNITDKTSFFVVDGHDKYVEPPTPMSPKTRHFWPIFPVIFNDIVCEPGCKATIFPPSTVQLMKSPQKAWNSARDLMGRQRKANAPKYLSRKGLLTDADKDALATAEPNQVVELEGIPNDQRPGEFLAPLQHAPIDPMAYDTRPLSEDLMYGARAQEANLGPAKPNVTATVGTIAEQSRMTVTASNVDDLDTLLTNLAEAGGEIMLREFSPDSIKKVVGPGAVWPQQDREDYINNIDLSIVASSSGRPNKAIEVANFQQMAPLLMQAGANPAFLVREGVKRLDDRIDVNEAFPLQLPQPNAHQAPVAGPTPSTGPGPVQQPTPLGAAGSPAPGA